MKNTTKAVLLAMVIISIIAIASALLLNRRYGERLRQWTPNAAFPGGVSGRVTTSNTTVGLASAYVAIVNASNTSQAFYVGQTDSKGFYQFVSINNTRVGSSIRSPYTRCTLTTACSARAGPTTSLLSRAPLHRLTSSSSRCLPTSRSTAERNNIVAEVTTTSRSGHTQRMLSATPSQTTLRLT